MVPEPLPPFPPHDADVAVEEQPPQEAAQPGPAEQELANEAEEEGTQRVRFPAEERFDLPQGRMTFYRTKRMFTAACGNPSHGKCTLTRSSFEGRNPAQGRPSAFMKCWLESGALLDSKEAHWAKQAWPSLSDRQAARETMLQDPLWLPMLEHMRGPRGQARDLSPTKGHEKQRPLLGLLSAHSSHCLCERLAAARLF